MHCIMPFSKRSLSPSGLRRVGDEMVWEVGKKAQVEESRERLLTPSFSHTYIRFFVRFTSRYVRDAPRMTISWLLLLMRARARARLAFPISCRTPIDEISMKHPSPIQGPRFRSFYFSRECTCVKYIREDVV